MKWRLGTFIKVIFLTFLGATSSFTSIASLNPHANNLSNPLSQFDLSPWKSYAENLKTCTSSEFILLDPIAVSVITTAIDMAKRASIHVPQDRIERALSKCKISYKILGTHKHQCKVIITPLTPGPTSHAMPLQCLFNLTEQTILSQRAEEFSKGPQQVYPNEAARQAVVRACTPTHS
jgi:hypothetical protein